MFYAVWIGQQFWKGRPSRTVRYCSRSLPPRGSARSASDHLIQLGELAERYADRQPDFADVCLIRMSELYPHHSGITVDRVDFRVYRRNKREAIPLICPPG